MPVNHPFSLQYIWLLTALFLQLLSACAVVAPGSGPSGDDVAYHIDEVAPDFEAHALYGPIFVVAEQNNSYNRIGRASARFDRKGREEIYIDPADPVVYVDQQRFRTERGEYVNYLYRIHFSETPFSLFPFHLTYGKNGGLLVVVTVDNRGLPVLLTTVHTCGCYLAFFPTSHLPVDALPADWDTAGQQVFGNRLPGLLDFSELGGAAGVQPVFSLASGTHRLREVWLQTARSNAEGFLVKKMAVETMADLWHLPIGDGFTSFFETTGRAKGFVKNSAKLWERLFMSWWALDWRVGQDKALGPSQETGTVFYTSIKFWQRRQSDMWPFANFLRYWGWNL